MMTSQQSNTADGNHSENGLLAIPQPFIARITQKQNHAQTGHVTKIPNFKN